MPAPAHSREHALKRTPASAELEASKGRLILEFSKGSVSQTFQEDYSERFDAYFRRCHQDTAVGHGLFRKKKHFAVLAVGGYGRKELNLHSDIDVLILFKSAIPSMAKELAADFFYPLWDLGVDLGYGVRSLRDCMTLCRDDFEVLTSLMDARFLCGDSPTYLTLMENLRKKVIPKKAVEFVRWLEDNHQVRKEIFGDASYLLEPNLKDGIGGLRDYHQILWSAGAFFGLKTPRDLEFHGKLSHNEYGELRENLHFLWLVRNHLHHLSGRKTDRLGFEHQEKLAARLGFQDQESFLAVEQFMGKLHSAMATIKSLNRSFMNVCFLEKTGHGKAFEAPEGNGLHIHRGEIRFDSATAILSDPSLLLSIFEESARTGHPLSMEAGRLIREFLFLVDDAFRTSRENSRRFRAVLNGKSAFESLDKMLETGFLETFLPEFMRIRDRVQFDAYHIFPVGRHSLETVRYLKSPGSEKDMLLLDIFADLADPEPLFLAGLFHDLGKTEKDHARKGAAIARDILERMHYEKEGAEKISFLIENHLLLVETATRRDLGDEKVVVQCAGIIRNPERLKMLYLLTWADSRATGPRAWNTWIANLVQELFFKVLNLFEREELGAEGVAQKVEKTLAGVQKQLPAIAKDAVEETLSVLSPRYLLNCKPSEICQHIEMAHGLRAVKEENKEIAFSMGIQKNEPESCVEITFVTMDRPGLFADMAGVLALHNINILSAGIYTWQNGTAVDIFKVNAPPDPFRSEEIWEKVREDFREILQGRLSLEDRIKEKSAPSILSTANSKPSFPPKVTVDNRSSDFFTVVEVFADDRTGLLYRITKALFELELDIRIAKIATKGDQAADIFYVRDLLGRKVEEENAIEQIVKTLESQLQGKYSVEDDID